MSSRLEKVNSLLKKETSQLLVREVELPSGLLVTVMSVDVSSDLCYAKVLVSVLPRAREQEALDMLQKQIYRLQGILNRRLVLRVVPRINFRLYPLGRKEERIQKIIDQIKKPPARKR